MTEVEARALLNAGLIQHQDALIASLTDFVMHSHNFVPLAAGDVEIPAEVALANAAAGSGD